MEKEFVPHEQALALKELGFDEPCFGYWKSKNWLIQEKTRTDGYTHADQECSAPTFSQAFRWFREKYNLHIWISSKTNDKEEIVYIPHGRTLPDTIKNNLIVDIIPYYTGKTYKEAEIECLKKLIEIVKDK